MCAHANSSTISPLDKNRFNVFVVFQFVNILFSCLLYTSRIGGNLNQIARTLNEWHSPYPQLAGEVRAAVSDLAALKFEVLQQVGDAVGNIQTYQL